MPLRGSLARAGQSWMSCAPGLAVPPSSPFVASKCTVRSPLTFFYFFFHVHIPLGRRGPECIVCGFNDYGVSALRHDDYVLDVGRAALLNLHVHPCHQAD
jgi:hypothetical protein